MWDVLKDYPAARVRLEAIAVKRLEKYRKEPLKKSKSTGFDFEIQDEQFINMPTFSQLVALGRSRSTPGLVESKGKCQLSELEMHKKEVTSVSTATLLTDEEGDRALLAERNAMAGEETVSLASEETTTLKACKHCPPKSASPQPYAQVLSSQSPALLYPAPAHLLPPNVTLMNFDNRVQQAGLYPSAQIPFFAGQYTPYCGLSPAVSTNHLSIPSNSTCIGTPTPSNFVAEENSVSGVSLGLQPNLQSQDALLSEIKRLRERLLTLETENASMSMKLNQQQWQVENRYVYHLLEAILPQWRMRFFSGRLAEIELQICSANSGNSCSAQLASVSSNSSNVSADENERNKESIIWIEPMGITCTHSMASVPRHCNNQNAVFLIDVPTIYYFICWKGSIQFFK